MGEGSIDAERLESMSDVGVLGFFADGQPKRGEEYLELDSACIWLPRGILSYVELSARVHVVASDCTDADKALLGTSESKA